MKFLVAGLNHRTAPVEVRERMAFDESAIGGTYEAVRRWISDSRHRVIGPNREIYHSTSLVEIQFPIARQ